MNAANRPVGGRIILTESPDAIVAELVGDVDAGVRERAGQTLSLVLDRGLPLVLNLSRVHSIDSAGIAFLIERCVVGRDEGLRVTLLDPPGVVVEVLGLLGFDHDFQEHEHEHEHEHDFSQANPP